MVENKVDVPTAKTPEELENEQIAAFKDRFDKMVQELMFTKGMSRRKATRFLEKKARIGHRKIVKEGRLRQEKLRKEGKLVDTSDIAAKLDAEFEKELEAAGLSKDDLDPMVPAEQWPEQGSEKYEPPTRDF